MNTEWEHNEHRSRHGSRCSEQSRNIYNPQFLTDITLLPTTAVFLLSGMCAHMWINLWVCVHSGSLTLWPSSLCVSNSFTSLAHWTSHTSEVTSKHASPQPGVIKSLRQWKTGEEKWLNGSLYSHWCLTHRWYHLSPERVYKEIMMYFINYI